MTLNPCQPSTNYTTKITTVKRFIIEKIDSALSTIYNSVSVSLIVDFGILTIDNRPIDGLTNKVKQVFGDVSSSFIISAKNDAITAAQTDYITAQWTTAVFILESTALDDPDARYLNVTMTFTGTCPL